ncbi:K+-transporting ATPase KdpF subunit [Plasticicumulans lactativorans]|uniref:K+-transporting ATPase KdpF subunit n=1 Tax=Plasticicumulans lactativorans TaxID=1133106 RepID=A0A4R2LEA8_9GAMM|nr:K(+)-transporting ATPase subunit F [Plasticicumulans lactativorans]TCO81211.1 K+-transporting ATPase KdpF subunit [Plasticicumulans lactativorans]
MAVLHLLAAVVAVALAGFLLAALLWPERF